MACIKPQNWPHTSSSLLLPTKPMVARDNQQQMVTKDKQLRTCKGPGLSTTYVGYNTSK